MKTIDINSDLGESFGSYSLGDDAAMMALITSANIACGLHAGDPLVMQTAVRLAKQNGVAVGAHPGWPDLQGFGRRSMDLTPDEAEAFVLFQVAALAGFARAEGLELSHVKPHGALYNQAAKDMGLAKAIAGAVRRFSPALILVGLAGSKLVEAGLDAGLRVASEGFPDRAYEPDGSLRSRKLPGAVLENPVEAAQNGLRLAQEGIVISSGSQTRQIAVDTLCVHGDSPAAVETARALRSLLEGQGMAVAKL